MFIFEFIKRNKIYKKLIDYISEVLLLKYQFFNRKVLLNLNHEVGISKKRTKLSKEFYRDIFKILDHKDEIHDDSTWSNISNKYYKNFINKVKADKSNLEIILDDPSKFNLFYGFDNNCDSHLRLIRPRYIDYFQNNELVIDKILNLAQFLGVVRHNNPERYMLFEKKKRKIENLINKIKVKLSIKLDFKNVFPGEEGIITSRGILSNREIQAIYHACKIKEICKKNGYKKILEIGGGLGRTAYYCRQFGINDYTIVDLLVPRICQLNYLSRAISENEVVSEEKITNLQSIENKIKVISPDYLFKNNYNFDLIFNSDGITEIDSLTQRKYISFIKGNSKYFYSINHESNESRVINLFDNLKIKGTERNLYWLRKGYLEEHFKF